MWKKAPYKLEIWLNELKKVTEDPARKSVLLNRTSPSANHCVTTFVAPSLHLFDI